MNCRKRGSPKLGDVQVNKDPSKEGNKVAKKDDTFGMERYTRPQQSDTAAQVVDHPR